MHEFFDNMTNASFIIKAKLFIHQSPGLIGECALIVGIVLPWILPSPERWAGLLAVALGIVIIVYKYRQLKFHLYVLENSQLVEGEVVDIQKRIWIIMIGQLWNIACAF